MNYHDGMTQLNGFRDKIAAMREDMRKLQAGIEPQAVEDYRFTTTAGTVRLSELFGAKDDLIVIHNMGASCPYCTLWADGYNGIYDHLADRAAFVISSPDAPDQQARFADSRGWRFPMVSHQGTDFAADMGFRSDNGWLPGITVFTRQDGRVMRVSETHEGPGDDFCSLWHFFAMLPDGPADWQPKYKYKR